MSVFRASGKKSSESIFPSIRPTLDLDFANSKTLDPRITFERASGGTYVGADGLIKYAGVNEPRFNHDPVTGESLGLLIEEQRVNYVYNSTTATGWGSIRGSFTSQTNIISPDGTTNYVFLYTEDSQTGSHHIKIPEGSPSYTIADNTEVTVSAWIKNNGKDVIGFGLNDKSDVYIRGYYNFNTEEIYDVPGGYSLSVIKYPNDWYKFIFTGNGGSGIFRTGPVLSIFMIQNGTTKTTDYTGDGLSGVYIWGPQLEIGSFATSYIPTEGSTRTRSADNAQITGKNFTDFYKQDEGTFIVNANLTNRIRLLTNSFNRFFYVSQTFSAAGLVISTYLIPSSTGFLYFRSRINDSNGDYIFLEDYNFPPNNPDVDSANFAITYANHDFAVFGSGGEIVTGDGYEYTGSGVIRKNAIALFIGRQPSSSDENLNGNMKRLTYYPKRLSNRQLQLLTSVPYKV